MASQYVPIKNTAFDLGVFIYKTDGSVIANPQGLSCRLTRDFTATAGPTPTVADATGGTVKVPLTATHMNADVVTVKVTATTSGAIPATVTLHTATALPADLVRVNGDLLADADLTLKKLTIVNSDENGNAVEILANGTAVTMGGTNGPGLDIYSGGDAVTADFSAVTGITADAPAGMALESSVQAVKAKTDSLTFASGRVLADMRAINGGATDGNNATLKLKAIEVRNPDGDGVFIEGGNGGNGLLVYGSAGAVGAVFFDAQGAERGIGVAGGATAGIEVAANDGGGSVLVAGDVVADFTNVTNIAASVTDKTGFALTSAYDAAKTAASASSVAAVKSVVDAIQSIVENILRWFTNKRENTVTKQTLYADDGVTPLYEQDIADDGTTHVREAAE